MPVWAQTVPATPVTSVAGTSADATQTPGKTEEVVVTGSRVKRSNLESTSPVVTVTSADIQAKGLTNTADLLNQLPQTGAAAITNTSSNFLDDVSGINTVNLRNLGEQRTVVLIDGRRTVGSVPIGAGENAVDLSSIPSYLIDHVDVVTGGASSTYGSEAVAGVVNIVLKKSYDGVMFNQQFGDSGHGDSRTFTTDLLIGTPFANDRGHAVFALEYQDQGEVFSKDRNFAGTDLSGGVYTPSSYALGRAVHYGCGPLLNRRCCAIQQAVWV